MLWWFVTAYRYCAVVYKSVDKHCSVVQYYHGPAQRFYIRTIHRRMGIFVSDKFDSVDEDFRPLDSPIWQ